MRRLHMGIKPLLADMRIHLYAKIFLEICNLLPFPIHDGGINSWKGLLQYRYNLLLQLLKIDMILFVQR